MAVTTLQSEIGELIRRKPMTSQEITKRVREPHSEVRHALRELHTGGIVKHSNGLWMGAAHYNHTFSKR